MRYLLTSLLCVLTLSLTAQEITTYPYNPDVDSDSYVGITDLIELLAIYSYYFEAGEIMVNDTTLSSFLNDLILLIEANALPEGTASGQILVWDGNAWIPTLAMTGCTDSEACNYDSLATTFDNSCQYLDSCGVCDGPGEIYGCGCADIPQGDCDCDGNQLDALNVCGGECAADEDGDGICDDGDSCIGEADECGVCNGPGAIYDCGCSGIAEGECDCVGTPDIDLDGICDPEDDCVGTPDAAGVCNGDCATDADADGICDDNGSDTCDGSVDECGVCNGPGPIYECGCADLTEGACDCVGNTPDVEGNCPDYIVDTDGDGFYDTVLDPCLGLNVMDFNGHNYSLVSIGQHCWFQENLQTVLYGNGDSIAHIQDEDEWNVTSAGAYSIYNADSTIIPKYGLLYNWLVTNDDRSVCPAHWHVPSEIDWYNLADAFGGVVVAGGALKEGGFDHWLAPNTGATNSSGFTARAGGERGYGATGFIDIKSKGHWWSSNSVGATGIGFRMDSESAALIQQTKSLARGQSIRCKMDATFFGCTDLNFLEYNPIANVNDGSCYTPSIPGCTSTGFSEYNPIANVDDGSCDTLLGCSSSDFIDYHDNTYSIVAIGEQCWFKENLSSFYFANGDSILQLQDPVEWTNTHINEIAAWSFYQNDPDNVNLGLIYNFYAVSDIRNLCPSGWHISTDEDWLQLEAFLGMPSYDLYLMDLWRGSEFGIGNLLKSAEGWLYPSTVIPPQPSGFDAILSGYRDFSGAFSIYDVGGAQFWTSTSVGQNNAIVRMLKSDNREQYFQSGVLRYSSYYQGYKRTGNSARCVRD
jgi:uncharacterized protein (TIGR02145 family)